MVTRDFSNHAINKIFFNNKKCNYMKSDYEQKKQARIQRYKDLAAKNEAASENQFKRSSEMANAIPLGQPILIGHHSEKAGRRYRDKIHDLMGKSVASEEKAKYYEGRAASAEAYTAISSDDPKAVEKLKAKLAELESLQEFMKGVNKIIRNRKFSDEDKIVRMMKSLSIREEYAKQLLHPDCFN